MTFRQIIITTIVLVGAYQPVAASDICRQSLGAAGPASVLTKAARPLRVLLINPFPKGQLGSYNNGFFPHYGLQRLAFLAKQDGHYVTIIDEMFGQYDMKKALRRYKPDIVGVTGYTSSMGNRGYEIADFFKASGVKTVLGGPHVFFKPEEAAKHADSLGMGEAEEYWLQMLADASRNALKPRYGTGELPNISKGLGALPNTIQPVNGSYWGGATQASRGCKLGCIYCSVTAYNGGEIRRRPIQEVVKEVINQKSRLFSFIVDDNIGGRTPEEIAWFKELMRELIKAGNRHLWMSQTSVHLAEDPEALELAYRAGCRGLLVGFESFDAESLADYGKFANKNRLEHYKDIMNAFNRSGIAVIGALIMGAESDTPESVSRMVEKANELRIPIVQITKATPLVGTKLYQIMDKQGRLIDPGNYGITNFNYTTFRPNKMSVEEMDRAVWEYHHELAAHYLYPLRQAWRSLKTHKNLPAAIMVYAGNYWMWRFARAADKEFSKIYGFKMGSQPSERVERIRNALRWFPKKTKVEPASEQIEPDVVIEVGGVKNVYFPDPIQPAETMPDQLPTKVTAASD